MKNQCGKSRGCHIRTVLLPADSKLERIHSEVHGEWNDTKEVVSVFNYPLDKVA